MLENTNYILPTKPIQQCSDSVFMMNETSEYWRREPKSLQGVSKVLSVMKIAILCQNIEGRWMSSLTYELRQDF